MATSEKIDGLIAYWGERLFYPANRMVRGQALPSFRAASTKARATWVRERAAAAIRRAPQVMVKITGGGRGMMAIAAHLRYITKAGRLEAETETGELLQGKDAVRDLAEEWRVSGSLIEADSIKRDGINVMLSMPRGIDPMAVQRAAREFAKLEFADHKYVMVLHDHQANPHVHISVRRESKHGKRLNPRKADLQRWRETFADKLRDWGVEAEATRQPTRRVNRNYPPIWQVKAAEQGRLRSVRGGRVDGKRPANARVDAKEAWRHLAGALSSSGRDEDRTLATSIHQFINTNDPRQRSAVQVRETAPSQEPEVRR